MQKIIKYIGLEEYKKLLTSSSDNKELRLAIKLSFGSGLRISEILGYKRKIGEEMLPLTSDNINLETHQIKITDAKGGKWRVSVTPPNLNEQDLKLLPLKVPRRTLQYQFSQLTRKLFGHPINFHSLRHGFGNYQANVLEVPLPIVQQMMGHSRLDTTGIYTKANPEQAIATAWKKMTGETK